MRVVLFTGIDVSKGLRQIWSLKSNFVFQFMIFLIRCGSIAMMIPVAKSSTVIDEVGSLLVPFFFPSITYHPMRFVLLQNSSSRVIMDHNNK
jgi:branched-subunit amino acid permease